MNNSLGRRFQTAAILYILVYEYGLSKVEVNLQELAKGIGSSQDPSTVGWVRALVQYYSCGRLHTGQAPPIQAILATQAHHVYQDQVIYSGPLIQRETEGQASTL